MNGDDAVLKAILSLHQATEMQFTAVDSRFTAQDGPFDRIDARLAAQDTRLDRLERVVLDGFEDMRTGFAELKEQLGRRRGTR